MNGCRVGVWVIEESFNWTCATVWQRRVLISNQTEFSLDGFHASSTI